MKIGIFTDTYFPQVNGVTFTIELWKQKLEEMGHEVCIYYPSGKYKPKKNEFPFRSFEFKFYQGYRVAIPLGIEKKAKDLDIVHIHGLFPMAIAGLRVSQKYKLPKILTYHTPADEYIVYMTQRKALKNTLMKLYNYWEKQLLNSCMLVTCPSNVIKERLVSKGVKEVTVLSNGVDLELFHPVDSADFRKRYNIPAGKTLGFCGRFGYEKHIEDFIGIADWFDGELLIAGKGPAEEHYKKLAEGKKNVKFIGFLKREELREFYSSLDMFIFPSTAETQGLVALESMACGKPVVGANRLALKNTIQDGYNGYLYESGNLEDLKKKIELAYKNLDMLSANSKEYVKQHSVDCSMKKLVALYETILKNDGKACNSRH
jgi:1,2-diacylglycerol 3-alpha-glucosyltransferase